MVMMAAAAVTRWALALSTPVLYRSAAEAGRKHENTRLARVPGEVGALQLSLDFKQKLRPGR
ncbi:hypothetical protein T492DRAFT_877923 [Pavlovales sp. CCMP2436]|nr:hypothetical protein T492DRAFT_877923 [Pavlovales sp. CCMP2436]